MEEMRGNLEIFVRSRLRCQDIADFLELDRDKRTNTCTAYYIANKGGDNFMSLENLGKLANVWPETLRKRVKMQAAGLTPANGRPQAIPPEIEGTS